MNTQANTTDAAASKTAGQILAATLRQVFKVGTGTRRYRKNTDLHTDMIEAIENAVQLPGYFGPEKTAIFNTAWGAVMSYNKHVRGYRIDGALAKHINALSAYQFAALLGRMVDAGVSNTGEGERFFADMTKELRAASVVPTSTSTQPIANTETESCMTVSIPTWTRDFVTATTETDHGDTVAQHTGWRAVLDPTCMQRYTTYDEWDLTIVADDALHGPGQCGTDCHDRGSSATNLCGMSVADGEKRDVIDAARTALAEQGFRVDGPWVPDADGRLTAPLVPVILDPDCAAYEPETAKRMFELVKPGWVSESEERARQMAADLNAEGNDVCPTCLSFRDNGLCLHCAMIAERAAAVA